MDTLHFNLLQPSQTRIIEEDGEIGYFAKCRKLLKQLSKVPSIVRITKQHLKDILKGFKLKSKIIKVR